MKRAFIFSILTIVTLLLATACCDCRKSRKLVRPLVGTKWQLVQLMAREVSAEGESYTLTFHHDGTLTGIGDCNHLSAKFSTSESRELDIEDIGSTRRLCPNQEQENNFVGMLDEVTHYEMDANYMLLLSNGRLVAIMQAR